VTDVPRIVHNDWSSLAVAEIGQWQPGPTVSVVIPAYNCQASLDLTLASLSRQTYPDDLLEVVVVDDGSRPPISLPEVRPARCMLKRPPDGDAGWGPGHAVDLGVRHSSGEVILRLDADMVVVPKHVEAHARWHAAVPYAVSLGRKRFVDVAPGGPGWPTPLEVQKGVVERLFEGYATEPHDYLEKIIRRTDQLRAGDHLTFLAHVGATVAVRRELYVAAGGVNAALRTGEDTELGYRLAQAGAVFVPEPLAAGWHLGRSNVMRDESGLQRYTRTYLADLMPQPRWLRKAGGSAWSVPLVEAVMDVRGRSLELVRAAVDAILRGRESDLRVSLVADWAAIGSERTPVLADAQLDLRLIEATYRSDPRVRLVGRAPTTAFPAPYLITVPANAGLAETAIARIIEEADRHRAGLVRVPLAGDSGAAVELWRTAALGRAGWVRREGEAVSEVVAQLYGVRTLSADAVGVVDLSAYSADQLAVGIAPAGGRGDRWPPASVEVAGLRSWARATALVASLSAARIWHVIGRAGRRSAHRRGGVQRGR
jgi:glycosyltransferase involved in cell wall biosynthesis